jgi:predicted RNA binding protein YcfA (HicA-like mRNA interferase family)
MRIPRDIDGDRLAALLSRFDYEITRQVGSHIRMTTSRSGEHHLTIPRHRPLKVGTLSAIVGDVAAHLGLSKEQVLRDLFS